MQHMVAVPTVGLWRAFGGIVCHLVCTLQSRESRGER
jgi:hypothetical protein